MLLGREPELIAIDQALAAARLGTSSRLLIRGEPGIGKTALLEHAVSEAGSMRVLAARGVEFEADVPFAGLHELLHPTLALLDRLPQRHAAALRSSLGLGPRIEADRLIIGAAALGLISAYAEDRPLLITVDDAQWLDRASSEAIRFAARRLFADPVSILIAIRDEEESPLLAAGLPELRLSGLDQASAAALGLSPSDVEEAEAARGLVNQRAQRIEFVHPLARAAIYHSASPADRRAAHKALASVMSGADDVDRRAWHLAAAASGWDAAAAKALEGAAQRARESTGYAAAASAWTESARLTEPPELRAARLFNAAQNAWLGGRAEEAVDLLGTARRLAEGLELRGDIDNLRGHIAMRRGSGLEGYRMMVGAADALQSVDRLQAIRILADASLSAFGAGHPSDMLSAARQALDLVRPDDPPEFAVFAHVAYGALAILAGHESDGPKHLHESVGLLELVPIASADPLVLLCAGLVGLFLREAEAGRDLLDRALDQAREHAPTAALPAVLFMLG